MRPDAALHALLRAPRGAVARLCGARHWLARSTPMRVTMILVAIFVVASGASFASAYFVIRSTLDSAFASEIEQQVTLYQQLGTQAALEQRLASDIRTSDPELTLLQYQPDRGMTLANVAPIAPFHGTRVLSERALKGRRGDLADSYLARSLRVGAGQLIIAKSRAQVIEMGEIMLGVVLLGLLPSLAVAAVSGGFLARVSGRKIARIQTVLEQLTSGQMRARVPHAHPARDDLSQIGAAVNTMASAQEALIDSMRQVTADIAHDLKTPIQRVAVLLDRLERQSDLSAPQQALVGQAQDQTAQIVKTFQALLQLAQIEGGAVRERLTRTDLRQVTVDVVEFLEAEAEALGDRLSLDIAGAGPFEVAGDRHLLAQVLANLIENSMRHTPRGALISVTLRRIAGATAGQVELLVCDDGPGIPAGERDKVLRRLYRMEKSRTTEGNGLGLSLVAAICALHGAKLTLEAAPNGQGSAKGRGLQVRILFAALPK
ncbi:putative sensor histidine kinase TcrY [Aquimixticola soesokkakensis]|uniref:histidine kinase n=1 Tax=Aquimixticola soesokkakensis TaxID=1519096 RepID=A0A1Y5T9C8_9RHOB|nr:HAMP domain-containing sensor histidine kinase [Aquimixticola soesokkakensis]SLN55253.1 putative sensor histidine kinase TcrY [Aquimixticola soesokkakensis]